MEIPEGLDFEVVQVTGYLAEDSSLAERTQVIRERISQLPSYGIDIGKGEVAITTISEANWVRLGKSTTNQLVSAKYRN